MKGGKYELREKAGFYAYFVDPASLCGVFGLGALLYRKKYALLKWYMGNGLVPVEPLQGITDLLFSTEWVIIGLIRLEASRVARNK